MVPKWEPGPGAQVRLTSKLMLRAHDKRSCFCDGCSELRSSAQAREARGPKRVPGVLKLPRCNLVLASGHFHDRCFFPSPQSLMFETVVLEAASHSGTKNNTTTAMSTQSTMHPRAQKTVSDREEATVGQVGGAGGPTCSASSSSWLRQTALLSSELALLACVCVCLSPGRNIPK